MTLETLSVLALGLPANPTMADNLRFQFTGFMIVMTVLVSLWLVVEIIGIFFKGKGRKDAAARIPTDPLPSPGIAAAAPDSETIAVITAAVHTVLDGHYRILSISEHFGDNLGAWSVEGRRQIFSSHTVR
jgi:Na+-transporting methylmalonyl-CoA/oxaloacetate decarboxylase gamma subunit